MGEVWSASGTILFVDAIAQPLKRISVTGGTAVPLPFLKLGETYANPAFLPDGDHFLYQAGESPTRIEMAWLSSGSATHVLDDAARPEFVNGHLLFIRGTRVFAQQFDPATGQASGTPVPAVNAGTYSAAASVVVFQNQPSEGRLEWLTGDGQAKGTIGSVESYLAPRISPDGKRVLALVDYADLWSIPITRGVNTRLTFESGNNAWTVWSPDGKYVAYGIWGKSGAKLVRQASDGSGSPEVLYTLGSQYDFDPAVDWSADGRYLSYDARNTSTGRFENWILPLFGDRKRFQVLKRFDEGGQQGRPLRQLGNQN